MGSQHAGDCINCGAPAAPGSFCPTCGQRRRHRELRFAEIFADAVEQLVEWRLPWLRTITDLTIRPGAVARRYVDGHRIEYVNPVKYFATAVIAGLAVSIALQAQLAADGARVIQLSSTTLLAYLSIVALTCLPIVWLRARTSSDDSPEETTVFLLYLIGHMLLLVLLVFEPVRALLDAGATRELPDVGAVRGGSDAGSGFGRWFSSFGWFVILPAYATTAIRQFHGVDYLSAFTTLVLCAIPVPMMVMGLWMVARGF